MERPVTSRPQAKDLTRGLPHAPRAPQTLVAHPDPARPRTWVLPLARDYEDAAEREGGPIAGLRVRLAEQPAVLGQELLPLGADQRGDHRAQAGAADPAEHGILAGQHVQVGRLPRVNRAACAEQVQVVGWVCRLPGQCDRAELVAPAIGAGKFAKQPMGWLVVIGWHL